VKQNKWKAEKSE